MPRPPREKGRGERRDVTTTSPFLISTEARVTRRENRGCLPVHKEAMRGLLSVASYTNGVVNARETTQEKSTSLLDRAGIRSVACTRVAWSETRETTRAEPTSLLDRACAQGCSDENETGALAGLLSLQIKQRATGDLAFACGV